MRQQRRMLVGDPGMLASRGGGIPPLPVGAGPSVLGGGGEGAGGGGGEERS